MKLRNLLIGGALAAVIAAPVLADVNYTQGAGTVIFDFICFSTKHCSGHVPINSAGTEIATGANPLRTDPTGTTTQPVSSSAQGATADAPCAVPTSATACSQIAVEKAIANAANSANLTPTDCSGTITTGGTAQAAIAAQTTLHGFTIANIDSTAGSGEPVWINFTGTATASTAASYPLAAPTATTFAALASFTTPPGFGTNHAVSIVGATTGHKFSCTWW